MSIHGVLSFTLPHHCCLYVQIMYCTNLVQTQLSIHFKQIFQDLELSNWCNFILTPNMHTNPKHAFSDGITRIINLWKIHTLIVIKGKFGWNKISLYTNPGKCNRKRWNCISKQTGITKGNAEPPYIGLTEQTVKKFNLFNMKDSITYKNYLF